MVWSKIQNFARVRDLEMGTFPAKPVNSNSVNFDTKTDNLEQLGSLGQERVQNYLKTDPLEHPSGERPRARNGSETDRWLL